MKLERFNELLSYFYKLYDIIKEDNNVDGLDDKIDLIFSYYNHQEDIINKLRNINSDWVYKFDQDKLLYNEDEIKLPEVFILFKNFINNLISENYIECDKIKNKLLNDF